MELTEQKYKMEETIDHLEEIKLIWKGNENELNWNFMEEVQEAIEQLKRDIKEVEDEIRWQEYKNTEEYSRAEYEDMEIDSYRGK